MSNSYYKFVKEKFPEQYERMQKWGRRNISFSTIAPTGSVSILTQTSSGCEPVFMPYYMRRKKINPNDPDTRVDFTDDNGDKWQEYPVLHEKFKDWAWLSKGIPTRKLIDSDKSYLDKVFKDSPWYKSTANDIDWEYRLKMQEVLQKYTSHSISSTLNLPEDTTEAMVSKIYLGASKMNLKGITIYRDGSRSGVLVSDTEKTFEERPETIPCDIYHNVSRGEKFTTLIGLQDGTPYEVFCIPGTIAKDYKTGVLTKLGDGKYKLDASPDDSFGVFPSITDGMGPEHKALCVSISYALRGGTPVYKLISKLNPLGEDVTSFIKVICRNLGKYIKGENMEEKCPDCGTESLIYEEGCVRCLNCGYSRC